MRRRLTLVGYRASGKSTLGRALARELGWGFVDADQALEAEIGGIAAFFAARGEAAFREREAAALRRLLDDPRPGVLATGGGVVLRADNRAALRADGGLVCYLRVAPEVLQRRLRADAGGRPSLTGAGVADEVPRLLVERDPLYREVAGAVVDGDRPAAALVAELAALVAARLGADPDRSR